MEEIRPIDANALKKEFERPFWEKWEWEIICKYIDNAPTIPLPDLKASSHTDEKCKTCKYYFYAFEGFPCIHCQRNFTLADEIREQQNDRWKDGTSNG